MLNSEASSANFRELVLPFLGEHDFGRDTELLLLRGGANNRVYQVTASGRKAVLKHYFKNPDDPRDRFRSERAFYEFVSARAIGCTPEPLAWESDLRLGLFSFIEGRKLRPEEVNARAVSQALAFILRLNDSRQDNTATHIPIASEACFSISEHLNSIQKRVMRLQAVEGRTEVEAQAAAFIGEQLQPAWEEVRETISRAGGTSLERVLARHQSCLSPSDFGFHNALTSATGELVFFDFEYAGWDDPAKLVCDFFCQPELPVSREHWDNVVNSISSAFESDGSLRERAKLLLPAYEIKWCCIMLNEFVRSEQARREFAAGAAVDRRAVQLDKARRALAKLESLRDEGRLFNGSAPND